MSWRRIMFSPISLGFLAVIFLFLISEHDIEVITSPHKLVERIEEVVKPEIADPHADIEKQKPLARVPKVVKAIYVTGYAAGSDKKMAHINDVIDTTEINAVVLDVKDYTGMVSYESEVEQVQKYGAFEKRIPKINALIKDFHDRGVYVSGRIAVFQDQVLVKARPDLALHASSTGRVWKDYKGVSWLDTASREVWDYNIAIAKEALSRGFDEINFDYIRFPSDGNLDDIRYPFYDEVTLKRNVVRDFFAYVRKQLPDAKLSADLFGQVTTDKGDMGIGQYLEYSFAPFDVVAPMTYPSHYGKGFAGYDSPAHYPYQIMKYAMDGALTRLSTVQTLRSALAASSSPVCSEGACQQLKTTFRPWIQDFDIGADYNAGMVRAQIQAIYDAGCSATVGLPASSTPVAPRTEPCSEQIDGWYVWNPSNVYTKEAFLKE